MKHRFSFPPGTGPGARPPPPNGGFTLLEVWISSFILGMLLLVTLALLTTSERAFSVSVASNALDAQARDLIERLAQELRQAGYTTLLPPNPNASTTLSFQQATGYAAGRVQWGPVITYSLTDFPTQPGAPPLKACLRTSAGNGTTVATGIVPNGLTFTLTSDGLVLSVTLQRTLSSGETLVRTGEITIALRNP